MTEAERRRAEAARAAIERADREVESLLTPSIRRAAAHFAARDADPADRIEVWGRRIGRSLSVLGVVALFLLLAVQLATR